MKHALTAVALLIAASTAVAQRQPAPAAGDLVELDIIASDRDGRPVTNLHADDFRVRDDGKAVDIRTFEEVTADGIQSDRGRSLILLLDDSGIGIGGTSVVQAMASRVLTRMGPRDEVTVVRLNHDRDEPFGDHETALARIAGYRGGAVPFQSIGTARRLFDVLTSISRQLEADDRRRKIVLCIGAPAVCNVGEPEPRGYSELWQPWVTMMSAAARANVSVYAALPTRPGGVLMIGGALPDLTGGLVFSNTEAFDAFIGRLWADAGHYYLLGFWPTSSDHDLRSISVKANRKGLEVRSRRER